MSSCQTIQIHYRENKSKHQWCWLSCVSFRLHLRHIRETMPNTSSPSINKRVKNLGNPIHHWGRKGLLFFLSSLIYENKKNLFCRWQWHRKYSHTVPLLPVSVWETQCSKNKQPKWLPVEVDFHLAWFTKLRFIERTGGGGRGRPLRD